MNKKRKAIIEKNEISEIFSFELGGYSQKVLIEGRTKDLPIVISLHGGPGSPIPFSVGCRGLFEDFTNNFIMVYWDQYGCGINNAKIDNKISIDSFVDMSEELINEVKKLFPENKILLFSTSWGSILSAKLLERKDNIVDGVVVWGQIVKNVFYNEEVYNELSKSNIPKGNLDKIRSADVNHINEQDLKLISNCLRKYTNAYQNKNGKSAPMGGIIKGLITSPDYKLKDFIAIMVNGCAGNCSLWQEILNIDLSDVISKIDIPYIMIQGDTDIVASTNEVMKLVDNSNNSKIKAMVVENSGHYPGVEGMDKVLEELHNLADL